MELKTATPKKKNKLIRDKRKENKSKKKTYLLQYLILKLKVTPLTKKKEIK
jgi:hypothetical protein